MVVCFWFFLPRTLPEIEPRASSVDGIWAFECGQGVNYAGSVLLVLGLELSQGLRICPRMSLGSSHKISKI
jgi:hypothetical protein